MFSKIRGRMSPAGLVAVVVLVFAMTGGAYAAKKYLITSTKQISPAVLAQLKGAKGAAGSPGAQGPAGPAGPAGSQGASGSNGTNGERGEKGEKGDRGEKGEKGADGQTGFTETLPPAKTETGVWTLGIGGVKLAGKPLIEAAISFSIPLPSSAVLEDEGAVFLDQEETENKSGKEGCNGTDENPTAPPGELCIYTHEEQVEEKHLVGGIGNPGGMNVNGVLIHASNAKEDVAIHSFGSWAVTAPTE